MSDINAAERGGTIMNNVTDTHDSNVWSVFFWGLIVCIGLGALVYLIG